MPYRALIAEDEPLLAQALRVELTALWPDLRLLPTAPDGETAVSAALQQHPELLFLDIRMPGLSGLDAAQAIVEDWPPERPLPLIVFVTAYDQHALEAFERSAVDYVLKPVQAARLAQTCDRLRAALKLRAGGVLPDAAIEQLRGLLDRAAAPAAPPLRVIQAGVGSTLHFVPVGEVLYFEAADKYVRVVTAEREHLVRSSLRDLLPQLDAGVFWQIHRGTVVRADTIVSVTRDEAGKQHLLLRGRSERLAVSRLYAHRFKAM
ncbi:LytTR family DNA-binding domain-containing protein [uncultured Methylibium sp.]|uniref:LytR/AlgR family response regulator transcription factor n=1 Tax=uncultured Methylibium sp. TaxID=381093 RepID=UPI0025F45394|nr:LytTR family DNA-binding domain-containing protein [uncultured Methylibium sp.]